MFITPVSAVSISGWGLQYSFQDTIQDSIYLFQQFMQIQITRIQLKDTSTMDVEKGNVGSKMLITRHSPRTK